MKNVAIGPKKTYQSSSAHRHKKQDIKQCKNYQSTFLLSLPGNVKSILVPWKNIAMEHLNQSCQIPQCSFHLDIALQTKFSLCSKFLWILRGCWRYLCMFCSPGEKNCNRFPWETMATVLGVWCWWLPVAVKSLLNLLRRLCLCQQS